MRLKNKKKISQQNSGFTLVELIVSMAIFAIVGVAIASFFILALRQYKTNTNEANIQTESQMAWKRLESNILVTTNAIWIPTDSNESQIDLYNYDESNKKYTKTSIYYKPSDNDSIYYQDYNLVDGNWVKDGEEQVFARLVTSFKIEMFDKDGHKIGELDEKGQPKYKGSRPVKVDCHITYDANGREYDSTNTVAIRNSIVASDDIKEIYPK